MSRRALARLALLAALLASRAPADARELAGAALCRALEGKEPGVTLVNLTPGVRDGKVFELNDVDVDGDGKPDRVRLDCLGSARHGGCTLDIVLARPHAAPLTLAREGIALVQAGSRLLVTSTHAECHRGTTTTTSEVDAIVGGRFVRQCRPTTTTQVARTPDC